MVVVPASSVATASRVWLRHVGEGAASVTRRKYNSDCHQPPIAASNASAAVSRRQPGRERGMLGRSTAATNFVRRCRGANAAIRRASLDTGSSPSRCSRSSTDRSAAQRPTPSARPLSGRGIGNKGARPARVGSSQRPSVLHSVTRPGKYRRSDRAGISCRSFPLQSAEPCRTRCGQAVAILQTPATGP